MGFFRQSTEPSVHVIEIDARYRANGAKSVGRGWCRPCLSQLQTSATTGEISATFGWRLGFLEGYQDDNPEPRLGDLKPVLPPPIEQSPLDGFALEGPHINPTKNEQHATWRDQIANSLR